MRFQSSGRALTLHEVKCEAKNQNDGSHIHSFAPLVSLSRNRQRVRKEAEGTFKGLLH